MLQLMRSLRAISRTIRAHSSVSRLVAVVALVFAMTGGALAANKYIITSTKQIKPSVLKQLRGKAGPQGAPGALGAPGAQGTPGAQGPAGPGGPKGETGAQGPAGAKGEAGAAGAKGEKGTTGEKGLAGEKGTTGTTGFTEELPSGKTETGMWTAYYEDLAETTNKHIKLPLSFPIKVPATASKAFVLNEGESENNKANPECPGTSVEPAAAKGVLCIYTNSETATKVKVSNFTTFTLVGGEGAYSPTGAFLDFQVEAENAAEPGRIEYQGSWAVTAP